MAIPMAAAAIVCSTRFVFIIIGVVPPKKFCVVKREMKSFKRLKRYAAPGWVQSPKRPSSSD
jgi:hypothetical protein